LAKEILSTRDQLNNHNKKKADMASLMNTIASPIIAQFLFTLEILDVNYFGTGRVIILISIGK